MKWPDLDIFTSDDSGSGVVLLLKLKMNFDSACHLDTYFYPSLKLRQIIKLSSSALGESCKQTETDISIWGLSLAAHILCLTLSSKTDIIALTVFWLIHDITQIHKHSQWDSFKKQKEVF